MIIIFPIIGLLISWKLFKFAKKNENLCEMTGWEDVRDELSDSYGPDEEPSDDDIREVYLDHRDNWLDYRVEKYEEGKDYE